MKRQEKISNMSKSIRDMTEKDWAKVPSHKVNKALKAMTYIARHNRGREGAKVKQRIYETKSVDDLVG